MNEELSPMVLIHGFTDTPRTWDPVVPLLREHHDVRAVALVGHSGGDPIPEGRARPLQAMIEGVERAMDDAGHERAHLVGNSLGGYLSLELAARGRALSVVTLSPGGGWAHGSPAAKRISRRFELLHRISPVGARFADELAARPRLRRLVLRDFVSRPERMPPAAAAALLRGAADCAIFDQWAAAHRDGTFRSDFGEIDVPVLIAWGTDDRILPRRHTSEHFLSAVPNAEWTDLPGLGHLPQHDDPELVTRTILGVTRPREGAPS